MYLFILCIEAIFKASDNCNSAILAILCQFFVIQLFLTLAVFNRIYKAFGSLAHYRFKFIID